jgi:hypothetical protein
MPGCLSYVVAKDPTDPDSLWVTEAWEDQDRHQASLSLPSVQAAIIKAKPIIAGFGERFETQPVGGYGLGTIKRVAYNPLPSKKSVPKSRGDHLFLSKRTLVCANVLPTSL